MLGTDKNKLPETKDIDALDALRRWIKVKKLQYGYLRPSLTIQNGMIERVKISQGDITITLKPGDEIN